MRLPRGRPAGAIRGFDVGVSIHGPESSGGIGTIFGPVAGSYIILSLRHFLSPYVPWMLLVQSIVFMVFVLLFRQGVVDELQRKLRTYL